MGGVTRFLGAAMLVATLLGGLSGCLTVRFVEDYDPVLDQGLTAYQAEIAAFMAKMSSTTAQPEGGFAHPEVQAFYARTGAQLQSFVDRAEALDEEGRCLPANFVGRGIEKVVKESADFVRSVDLPFGEVEDIASTFREVGEGGGELGGGNCTVVVLKVVRANHELLRKIHESNGTLPKVVAGIAGPILDQSVRIAIKNEVLKKNRGG